MPPLVRVFEVSLAEPLPDALHGWFLEAPQQGRVVEASSHQIEICGWVIGKTSRAIGVEIRNNGQVERRVVIGRKRPDLAEAFPDVPGAAEAGFQAFIPVAGPNAQLNLEISVILADRRVIHLATVRGERIWRGGDRPVSESIVSVVIPGFDDAQFLRESLDSVMAQTHPHVEVVVIDDGSHDNLEEITSRYPAVRCVRQENNGLAEARNTGTRNTIGDYLVFLDAGDRLLPEALEIGLRAFAAKPASGYVFGGLNAGYLDLLKRRSLLLGEVMFRRSAFEGGRRFDETVSSASDWDLLLTGMREFPVYGHGRTVESRPQPASADGDVAKSASSELAVLRRHRSAARKLPGGREAYRAAVQRVKAGGRPGIGPASRRPAPKLTVVMLTYNHAEFITEAIESALRQKATFRYEVIVADDCSTDGTREIVSTYHHRYPDLIRVILPESNVGAHALWRRAIDAANGEYIAFLDGDDYWTLPTKLQAQVRLLDEHPEHALAFHDVTVVADGDSRGDRPRLPDRRVFGLGDVLPGNFIPTGSVVVRRAALDPLPSWVTWAGPGDWMTWVAAAQSGSIAYIAETMGVYRVHSGGVWTGLDRTSQIHTELAVQEHLARSLPRYASVCRAAAELRHVQLAVERCQLPYERPTVVVGAIPVGGWYYFNGRTTQILDQQGLVTAEELERVRHGAESDATPDNRPTDPPREGSVVPVVVPVTAALDIADWGVVQEYLDAYPVVWSDEHCTIFELPVVPSGPQRSVEGVVDEATSAPLVRGRLERPAGTETTSNGGVYIAGWVLGGAKHVDSVRADIDGEILRTVPVAVRRRDVAEAFPHVADAGTGGFHMWLDLESLSSDDQTEVSVRAVLANGETMPLGVVVVSPTG